MMKDFINMIRLAVLAVLTKDVEVDANGYIVITHETGDGAQGFYIMQPTK